MNDDHSNTNKPLHPQATTGSGLQLSGAEALDKILFNGHQIAWESMRVTFSVERFPASFEVETSASVVQYNPQPGDSCVMLTRRTAQSGSEVQAVTLFTGWIDSVQSRMDARSHTMMIRGRSRCCDLVDCSAEFPVSNPPSTAHGLGIPDSYVSNTTLRDLAEKLCQPYNINLVAFDTSADRVLNQVATNIGETPYAIIERVARSQNRILIDNNEGNLVLAELGTTKAASGLVLGKNIQSITRTLDVSQRYSLYNVFTSAVYVQNSTVAETLSFYGTAVDDGIKRHRRLMGFSEAPYVSQADWTQGRATWERNRRYGRSQVVQIVTDQWFDADGVHWQPNNYIDVQAPRLGFDTSNSEPWLIAEVTLSRNNQAGTTATLTLMPKQAFSIEPVSLLLFDPAIAKGIEAAVTGQSSGSEPPAGGLT